MRAPRCEPEEGSALPRGEMPQLSVFITGANIDGEPRVAPTDHLGCDMGL